MRVNLYENNCYFFGEVFVSVNNLNVFVMYVNVLSNFLKRVDFSLF